MQISLDSFSPSETDYSGEILAVYPEEQSPSVQYLNRSEMYRVVSTIKNNEGTGRVPASQTLVYAGIKVRAYVRLKKVTIGSVLYHSVFGSGSRL